MDIKKFIPKPAAKLDLSEFSTNYTADIESKQQAKKLLKKNIKKMSELQDKLYAQDKYSVLIIFQAMDAAGKDGAIKHVMSGLNPQGTQVFSFKQPSKEELDHGYLWRIHKATPERGRIGIFNRSHYEEVLIVRVHNLLKFQRIPEEFIDDNIWEKRFNQIKNFERYLYENGTIIIKFFLHISREEQKRRFLSRIENPAKNWKFSSSDVEERKYWNDYMKAYQEAIAATTTNYAPWYIIPADKKWFARLAISEVIVQTLNRLKPEYPKLSKDQIAELHKSREDLLNEK